MLKLENVHASYGSIEVLHGINIEVREKEIVTIIGANGAGKSTTLKAIAGTISQKARGAKLHTRARISQTFLPRRLSQRVWCWFPRDAGFSRT